MGVDIVGTYKYMCINIEFLYAYKFWQWLLVRKPDSLLLIQLEFLTKNDRGEKSVRKGRDSNPTTNKPIQFKCPTLITQPPGLGARPSQEERIWHPDYQPPVLQMRSMQNTYTRKEVLA